MQIELISQGADEVQAYLLDNWDRLEIFQVLKDKGIAVERYAVTGPFLKVCVRWTNSYCQSAFDVTSVFMERGYVQTGWEWTGWTKVIDSAGFKVPTAAEGVFKFVGAVTTDATLGGVLGMALDEVVRQLKKVHGDKPIVRRYG